MVARDGIEPPTPAFSGPRSTTELSGLGITLIVGDRQEPPRATFYICRPGLFRGAVAGGEPATQTHLKYNNPAPLRQPTPLALSFLIARIARTLMFVVFELPYPPRFFRSRRVAPAQAPIRTTAQSAARNTVVAATPANNVPSAPSTPRQSPLELHAFLIAYAEGRRPPHAPLRRHLCRDIHKRRRRRSSLRRSKNHEFLQAQRHHPKPSAATRLWRRQRPRGERLQGPEALRCPHRLLLHAQLRPQRRHQRP